MNKSRINTLRKLIIDKKNAFNELYANSRKDALGRTDNQSLLVRAIDLIVTVSQKMALYENSYNIDFELYNEIANLSRDELAKIAEESYTRGAISIIRYVIAQMFIRGEITSAENLKEKIERLKRDFIIKSIDSFIPYLDQNHKDAIDFINSYGKGNPFQSWGPLYRYLLPFVYDIELRDCVWKAIEIIRNELLWSLNIETSWESKNSQGWYNKVRSYFGFEGPSNYGSQRAVLMLHPKNIPDHKNAIQLVCYFTQGTIWTGWDVGVNLRSSNEINIKQYLDDWENIYPIDFNDCCGIELSENKIIEKFNSIIHVLKKNFNFAADTNKLLLEKHPELGDDETAEGNAESSKGDDINLYDQFETGESAESDDNTASRPTTIKNATNRKAKTKLQKTIYSDIEDDEDFLNRKALAKYLAEQIILNRNVLSLNIGIYADWGSGKTQIFNLIKNHLKTVLQSNETIGKDENLYSACEIVDFDAWQYSDQEHIWAALVVKLLNKCKSYSLFYFYYLKYKLVSYLKNHWQEIIIKFVCIFLLFVFLRFTNDYLQIDILERIFDLHPILKFIGLWLITLSPDLFKLGSINIDKSFIKYFKLPEYTEMLGFREEIRELICFVMEYLSQNKEKRIVLFIDNLDRCSSKHIKQILDAICQFLEPLGAKRSNLIVMFAMDKTIIYDALRKEDIKEDKIDEYLQKIINLPIHPKMPPKIDELINRFFGEEENETKKFLREQYELKPYNPRVLSNLRYIDHLVYNVYDDLLKDSNYYADLFKLQSGNNEAWELLSNQDVKIRFDNKTFEANKYNPDDQQITKVEYEEIENKAIKYLEKLYGYHITQHISYNIPDKNRIVIFDGIAVLQEKDILFEIKYVVKQDSILKVFDVAVMQFLRYPKLLNTDKHLELNIVFVVDNITNKEQLLQDLNREYQRKLLNSKFSGHVLLIDKKSLYNL